MKHRIWKYLLSISLALLPFLFFTIISVWALGCSVGSFISSIMNYPELNLTNDVPLTFGAYLCGDFIGSPLFYVCLADVTILAISIVMLIVKRKQSKTKPQ